MGTVFLNVLHMSLAAALMAVAVMVVRFLLNKLLPNTPKAIHCALWALVALRLVLPVSVESPFSLIPADVAQGEVLSQWRDAYTGTTITIFDQTEGYDEAVAAGREQYYAGEEGHYYVVTGEDGISAPDTVETTKIPALGWIWLAGVVVMVAYAAFSFFRIRRRVRLSIPLRDNILRCEQVDSPFILGLFRPKIYLPYDMDEAQARHVIAHEEAHLRRRDHWWKPLGFLLLAVYWFNPVLWVAYILLCRDIELACDERVIREMDNTEKKAYSEALLQCSLPRRMVAACPLAFGEVGVKERIASVLHYKKPAFWVLIVAVLVCIAVAVCFMTNPTKEPDLPEKLLETDRITVIFSDEEYDSHVEVSVTDKETIAEIVSIYQSLRLKKYSRPMADDHIQINFWDGDESLSVWRLSFYEYDNEVITVTSSDAFGLGNHMVAGEFDHEALISLLKSEGSPEAIAIWSLAWSFSPTEMMAYLCQADLWNDAIKAPHEISMMGNFDTTVWFSEAPANSETLDLAMARRACMLMHLFPDEVFYVMWSYPDGNGGTARREFHADEMAAIIGLSSHTGVIAQPDSAKDVEMQLGFLASLDEKLFIKWAASGNSLSPLFEAQKTAVWFTPEDIHDIEYMELVKSDGQRLHIGLGEGYEYVESCLSSAAKNLNVDCPFENVLYLHRADNVVGKVLIAADTCTVFQSDEDYYTWIDPSTDGTNAKFYGYFAPDGTPTVTSALTPEAAGRLLDVIVSSPTEASGLAAYMGEHPEEVETLLMNPEPTLEYIFTQFLNGGQTGLKGSLMRLVLDELAPEAQLRLYAETGQEYFDEWMKGADQMASDHGLEWLKENQSAMYQMLCIRSDLYGHSSPMEAVKLPKAFELENEKQKAACNAIFNSLRTGWWTNEPLDPTEESAAFLCFLHETVGDEVNLYGYGGYFSRDPEGNDSDEWSSFCIVTLEASTLEMIEVWWPGDGAYHDMSITENFPEDLGFAALNATPQELQTLHKQLKKQADGNMQPVGLQPIA